MEHRARSQSVRSPCRLCVRKALSTEPLKASAGQRCSQWSLPALPVDSVWEDMLEATLDQVEAGAGARWLHGGAWVLPSGHEGERWNLSFT